MRTRGIDILVVGLCVWVFLVWLGAGTCAAADVETLREDIEKLQRQIDELKERLEKAESEKAREARTQEVAREEGRQPQKKSEEEDVAKFDIGGALRFNYAYRDYSEASKAKKGDMEFDLFRLNVDGSYKDVLISAEYRWYSFQNVIHHGWVGYNFSDRLQGQLGVTQVPFGLLPYASHSWWFAIPYYVGFEDDYDMGLKFVWDSRPWNLQLAIFKNGEWGDSSDLYRYSFDVVSDIQDNEETNQANARLAYLFDHGSIGSTEIGVSGQGGQIYNTGTDDFGDMWAGAIHLNGNYGPVNLMLEAVSYAYSPDNPYGVSDDTIEIGAFGVSSLVASKAEIYVAGLSYSVPVSWGPISNLKFYNDYSILDKKNGFPNSQINTTGCLISAGPIYSYIDYILGKNAQFLDGGTNPYGAAEDSDNGWHSRFNVNVGYYF